MYSFNKHLLSTSCDRVVPDSKLEEITGQKTQSKEGHSQANKVYNTNTL